MFIIRYYPLFGLMANVALIFSGQYVKYVSSLRSGLPIGTGICLYCVLQCMKFLCVGCRCARCKFRRLVTSITQSHAFVNSCML